MGTPTEPRKYHVFVRGPVGLDTHAFSSGTEDDYRGGVRHLPLLADFPAPQDNQADDFGIQAGGGFTVEIADEVGDLDWFILQEDFSYVLLEDNTGRLVQEY